MTVNKLIPVPAPPGLEEALGYRGDARFFVTYWSAAGGDEAEVDDGMSAGTGNWDAYLALVDHPAVLPHLGELRYALGSSDEEATHVLLVDRFTRALRVMPKALARRLLREQHEERSPEAIGEAVIERLDALFDPQGWTRVFLTEAELMRRIQQQYQRVCALVEFLDGFVK